jgi:hypothetical protein
MLTDLDGNPLQDLDQDRFPEVLTGDEFLFQVFVQDRRSPPPRLGVFSAYPVVPVDFTLVSTAYQEEQILVIDPIATSGTFNLQFGSSVTSAIDVANLIATPTTEQAGVIRTAIESLNGISPGDIEVRRVEDLAYTVVFTGGLANMDVTDLTPVHVNLTSDGTAIVGDPITVQERIAADPDSDSSFISAVNSASNLAVGQDNRTYTFAFRGSLDKQGPTPGLKNLGAAASIVPVGQTFEIDWAPGDGPTTPSLLFAVRLMANNAGTLTLQLAPPVAGDEFTPDELTYWPSPQAQYDELNLFPDQLELVDFGLPAVVDIGTPSQSSPTAMPLVGNLDPPVAATVTAVPDALGMYDNEFLYFNQPSARQIGNPYLDVFQPLNLLLDTTPWAS